MAKLDALSHRMLPSMSYIVKGFHRTATYQQAHDILTNGYKIYTSKTKKLGANTLNLYLDWKASVCNKINAETYGPFVVRFNVNASPCLVLDLEMCERLFGHTSIQKQLDFFKVTVNPELDLNQLQASAARKGTQFITGTIALNYIINYADNRSKIAGIIMRTNGNQPYASIHNLSVVKTIDISHSLIADNSDEPTGVPYTCSYADKVRWIKVLK